MNTGVLVLDPARHGDFLRACYEKYPADFHDFEQTPLPYELQANDMVEYIDPRFYAIWSLEMAGRYPFPPELYLERDGDILQRKNLELYKACVEASLENNYVLHFAGPMAYSRINNIQLQIDTPHITRY